MAYFYRRPNGVYYARVRVPNALLAVYGAPDLRRTLNTSDYATAQRLALLAAFEWKNEFERLRSMLDAKKLSAGSPILFSGGLISLDEAAEAVGLTTSELFGEARARASRVKLCLMADGWMGADVPRGELVRDALASASKTLVVDVGETLLSRELAPVLGTLFIRPNALALVTGGVLTDCLFFRDPAHRQAVVTDIPGVSVPVGALLIQRTDVEAIRAELAKKLTPEMHGTVTADAGGQLESFAAVVERTVMGPVYAHKDTRTSTMLAAFYAAKTWAPATAEQNKRMCGVFVELMNDPVLSDIDRSLIAQYRERLLCLPADLRNFGIKHKGLSLNQLAQIATETGQTMQAPARADRYIAKIGEAFTWAAQNEYMRSNPAANQAPMAGAAKRRAQDSRQQFDDKTLGVIFDQSWYQSGRGKKATTGKYVHFQPFNYWLPLLALFTGARLNELAQLNLKDVGKTDSGQWFIDFNLEGEGKIDADSSAPEKQLKTVNSQRVIAMHSELVRVGLPEYVEALRVAGHVRLFPELKHDRLKGYGKYAGQWFNERLLGVKLGIERDGTQTFHSFRHTFLTACDRLEMPDRLRNEIAGHERGSGQGHSTYIKDRAADEQAPFLAPLGFNLPDVARFDIVEGLKAVHDALERKSRQSAKAA